MLTMASPKTSDIFQRLSELKKEQNKKNIELKQLDEKVKERCERIEKNEGQIRALEKRLKEKNARCELLKKCREAEQLLSETQKMIDEKKKKDADLKEQEAKLDKAMADKQEEEKQLISELRILVRSQCSLCTFFFLLLMRSFTSFPANVSVIYQGSHISTLLFYGFIVLYPVGYFLL